MKQAWQFVCLLQAWVVTCVVAVGSRTFLAQPDGQADLIASKLRGIENDWQEQVAVSAQCEQGGRLTSRESCRKVEGLFTQSCTAIADAFVNGQGGDSRAVTFFMDNVCAGRAFAGWQRDTCLSFRGELLAAMATMQDAKLNAMGLCQRLWAHLIDRETLRGEDAKKDQDIKILKKELAETQARAAKASEEQHQKDVAEANKLEARALKFQAEALHKAQKEQQQQQQTTQQQELATEKMKRQAAEQQRRREAAVHQKEQAALEKHREEELAAKRKEAAEQQRQKEAEVQQKRAEEQQKETVATKKKNDEKASIKRKIREAADRLRKQKAAERQKQQREVNAAHGKQNKEGTGAGSTSTAMPQPVQQQAHARAPRASMGNQTLQAEKGKAGSVTKQHAVLARNVPVGNKTQDKMVHPRKLSKYKRWQKLKAMRMAKLKKLKHPKKTNVSAVLAASEEKRKLAELRAAAAEAALEKATHMEENIKEDTVALRKKRVIEEIKLRKQLAAEVRERRAKRLKEAKERHERAERQRLAYEADLKKRQESKAVYPLTKAMVNATSWEHHPELQVVHTAAPAPVFSEPSHDPARSLVATNHTPVSEGAGAGAADAQQSSRKKQDAEVHEAAVRSSTEKAAAKERGVSMKVAETRRPPAAAAASSAAADNTKGKHWTTASDSPTLRTKKATSSQQKVAGQKKSSPKATDEQRAKRLEVPLKSATVQQPNLSISAAGRPSLPIKALRQAASTVKVAASAKKLQASKMNNAIDTRTERTKEEQTKKASKVSDDAKSDQQGFDDAADDEGQDDIQSKEESHGQDESEDEESNKQDASTETESTQATGDDAHTSADLQGGDADDGGNDEDSEHNDSNKESEDSAPAPENDDR